MAQRILAFDLYGTLLSPHSSTKALSQVLNRQYGDKVNTMTPGRLAKAWRRVQLGDTWRLNSMKMYRPFSEVTREALRQVLQTSLLPLDDQGMEEMMKAHDSLETYADVGPTLQALAETKNFRSVVFSNGTREMLTNCMKNAPELNSRASFFSDIISVEEVKCFKPMPEVYQHLAAKVGKAGTEKDIYLVSGNPFDIVGAHSAGLRTVWLNRNSGGSGWVDTLIPGVEPDVTIQKMEDLMAVVEDGSSPSQGD